MNDNNYEYEKDGPELVRALLWWSIIAALIMIVSLIVLMEDKVNNQKETTTINLINYENNDKTKDIIIDKSIKSKEINYDR